jgi:predicted protein tyrosine phosphatase
MIYVCSLEAMPGMVARHGPSHVVSLLAPENMVETPPGVEPVNHLKLGLHDITEPFLDYTPPAAGHIETLLAFGAAWDRAAPLLVHCHAGVSRSTAAALILLCQRNPGREAAAAVELRERAPHAMPNRRMIALADRALALEGRLVAAVAALAPADFFGAGDIVALPIDF